MLKKYFIICICSMGIIFLSMPFFWLSYIYNISGNILSYSHDYEGAIKKYETALSYRYAIEIEENYEWALSRLYTSTNNSDTSGVASDIQQGLQVQKNSSKYSLSIYDSIPLSTEQDEKNMIIYIEELQGSTDANQKFFHKKRNTKGVPGSSYNNDPILQSIFGE